VLGVYTEYNRADPQSILPVGLEVLAVAVVKSYVFLAITPCSRKSTDVSEEQPSLSKNKPSKKPA
jgi:hypothetical protein